MIVIPTIPILILIIVVGFIIYYLFKKNKNLVKIIIEIVCILYIFVFSLEFIINIQNDKNNEFVFEKYRNNEFINISDEEFINYFKESYIEADKHFKNDILLLKGKITEIKVSDEDTIFIVFNGYLKNGISIECYFTNINGINGIENRDIVKVIGKYKIFENEEKKIILINCRIIEKN